MMNYSPTDEKKSTVNSLLKTKTSFDKFKQEMVEEFGEKESL